MKNEKVIIIGGGPAGLTAAIYTARAMIEPLIFEGYAPGGQLTLTQEVENFPGFSNGILGPELMSTFRKQAQRFGAKFMSEEVTHVNFQKKPYQVKLGQDTYETHSIIVATGASSKLLGLESENRFMGKGVSTCATCDGAFFKNEDIVVVGGGDTAMEEANFLSRFASSVTIIHRRDRLRASQIMQDRTMKNPKIKFIWNSKIVDILGTKNVEKIKIENVQTHETQEVSVAGIFIAIGHQPNTELFKNQINMDTNGYIVTHQGSHTNLEGVFACGDVQDHVYRQAITAAGSGCVAAIDCIRHLETLE